MIRSVEVAIRGTAPLLMHKFPMVPIEAIEKRSPEEQAEHSAYRDKNNVLFIPGICVQRGMVAAAAFSKGKGRATLSKPVAACVIVSPERLLLNQTEYTVDSRPVVVPATRGRVIRHRPRIDEWSVDFVIEWDDNLLKESELRRVVDDTGLRVGLLDFRPERKGPFGRFMVTSWKSGSEK